MPGIWIAELRAGFWSKNGDAAKYIAQIHQKNEKFDVAFVDAYIGNKSAIPEKNLKDLGKLIVINSLEGTKNAFHFLGQLSE